MENKSISGLCRISLKITWAATGALEVISAAATVFGLPPGTTSLRHYLQFTLPALGLLRWLEGVLSRSVDP